MRSVKDYSTSADAAQGAMHARGGARPNKRWRVLARDRQRGKDLRLSFDNIGLRRDHDTIINPIAGNDSGIAYLKSRSNRHTGEAPDRKGLITREEFMEKISEERAKKLSVSSV